MGTETKITGLEHYSLVDIESAALSHIRQLGENYELEELDFAVSSISFFGSRLNGKPRTKSDLDVKLQYTGSAREDDIFNALNSDENRLFFDNIPVDFYPVRTSPRGNWATHRSDWRGNWSPEVARNLILRYSNEGDILLDPMIGGGTTAIEAKILNRNIICSDINDGAIERTKECLKFDVENKSWQKVVKRDARDLGKAKDETFDR